MSQSRSSSMVILKQLNNPAEENQNNINDNNEYDGLEIGNNLQSGTFADVFKGIWKDQTVAIKTMKFNPDHLSLYRNEVEILKSIVNSPNVIQYLHHIDDAPCWNFQIIMEYVELGDLSEYIAHNPHSPFEWVACYQFCKTIANGLENLHDLKILHRDIKSENILVKLTKNKLEGVITDFGCAVKLMDDKPHWDNKIVGTTTNTPPEIYSKKEGYSTRTDIFSFGILLFEITNWSREPYAPLSEKQILPYVEAGGRPKIPDTYPRSLRKLIKNCWAQDSSSRPPIKEINKKLDGLAQKELKRLNI